FGTLQRAPPQTSGAVHLRRAAEAAKERNAFVHLPNTAELATPHPTYPVDIALAEQFLNERAIANGGIPGPANRETSAVLAVYGEVAHAIVIHADRIGLICRGIAAIHLPIRRCVIERSAPWRHHRRPVILRHHQGIFASPPNGLETEGGLLCHGRYRLPGRG